MGSNPPMFTAAVMRNAWCQLLTNLVAFAWRKFRQLCRAGWRTQPFDSTFVSPIYEQITHSGPCEPCYRLARSSGTFFQKP